MKLIHPRNLSGDGSSADGDYASMQAVYRWVPGLAGSKWAWVLIDQGTGERCGVATFQPLLGVWTARLLLPGHELASCTRTRQHQARVWVVQMVRLHRRLRH